MASPAGRDIPAVHQQRLPLHQVEVAQLELHVAAAVRLLMRQDVHQVQVCEQQAGWEGEGATSMAGHGAAGESINGHTIARQAATRGTRPDAPWWATPIRSRARTCGQHTEECASYRVERFAQHQLTSLANSVAGVSWQAQQHLLRQGCYLGGHHLQRQVAPPPGPARMGTPHTPSMG